MSSATATHTIWGADTASESAVNSDCDLRVVILMSHGLTQTQARLIASHISRHQADESVVWAGSEF